MIIPKDTKWKDINLCEMCEHVNSERIPYNYIIKTVEPKDCDCCKEG